MHPQLQLIYVKPFKTVENKIRVLSVNTIKCAHKVNPFKLIVLNIILVVNERFIFYVITMTTYIYIKREFKAHQRIF